MWQLGFRTAGHTLALLVPLHNLGGEPRGKCPGQWWTLPPGPFPPQKGLRQNPQKGRAIKTSFVPFWSFFCRVLLFPLRPPSAVFQLHLLEAYSDGLTLSVLHGQASAGRPLPRVAAGGHGAFIRSAPTLLSVEQTIA